LWNDELASEFAAAEKKKKEEEKRVMQAKTSNCLLCYLCYYYSSNGVGGGIVVCCSSLPSPSGDVVASLVSKTEPCMSVVKTQSERWKGCARETSVIHSHFMLTFAWCFSIASISGPSSKQKQTFASLLYKRLTWRTPNSSVGDAHNSFKFASLKGTL
jgi:hypothetical protein